uniref:Condensation domain-containing protein n=1 Tax=Corethron hystrix TaxID=216773 RepID=A0A7S1BZZ1_9STRA|mmetsp:Transcript_5956/g.12687  ORF Transcript_5956/g.12687 Transcript_5956/m.12687 type:complete len:756 (+) Transcript_5956:134-2401(+)
MKFPVDRPTSATGSRFLALLATIVLRSAGTSAFVPAPLGPGGPFGSRTLLPTRSLLRTARPSFPLLASSSSSSSSVPVAEAASSDESASSRRTLGSQELLMLPRQYRPSPDFPFPSMTHCSAYSVGRTPSLPALVSAVEEALAAHPLLRARVEGEGEPSKRIDLFQMVREGDPDPPTFVADASVAAGDVLEVVEVDGEVAEEAWKETFRENLDGATYDAANGPLWKMTLFRSKAAPQESRCVILFTFNHVISDQSSANMIMDQILSTVASIEAGDRPSKAVANAMPRSLEENVLGKGNTWPDGDGPSQISPDTLLYVANKAAEGFKSPVILPDDRSTKDANGAAAALTTISGKSAGGTSSAAFGGRETTLQFRELTEEATEALRLRCREEGVTVTAALAAAVACASSDVVAGENPGGAPKGRNFKVLQSLDMRRVSRTPDPLETVSCQAGSMDLMLGPLSDRTGTKMAAGEEQAASFWNLAREAQSQTQKFVDSDGPKHAVRVFDFAMSISDLNNLVHLTAQSEASQGRAYSAGISNAGVFERQRAVRREGDPSGPEGRENLRSTHGPYVLEDVRFATSHARSGCLYQVSCLTVGGKARFTFHPAAPVVSDETNRVFADRYLRLLEVMAGVREASPAAEDPKGEEKSLLPPNALTLVAAAGAAAGVLVHAEGWASFFSSLAAMRQNVPDDADFWAALNFWIFFAGETIKHPPTRRPTDSLTPRRFLFRAPSRTPPPAAHPVDQRRAPWQPRAPHR